MNKERFQIYASIAEIVSAVAIVISLLYVGYEIQRTDLLSHRDVDELLFERNREDNRVLIENSDMAQIIVTARENPDALTPAERIRYLAFEHNFYDNWEIAFYSHRDGVLLEEYWTDWKEFYTQEAKRRPKFAWTENRHLFVGPFAEYVDGILLEQ